MTSIDLSFAALFAGSGYRVTGQFDGVDLLNGGKHRATDVGNFGMDDPIKAATTRGRGLYHFDTALGYEDDLGDGWTLERWHLNATMAAGLSMVPGRSDVGDWTTVARGQLVGRTGNSGARLPDGRPMPAHTHIVLKQNGVPLDVEPYLLGAPLLIGEDSPMFDPAKVVNLYGTRLRALPGANIRSGPTLSDPIIAHFANGFEFLRGVAKINGEVAGVGELRSAEWWALWIEVEGKTQVAYGHTSALIEVPLPAPTGITQEQLDAAKTAAFTDAKTKARVAVEGIKP